MGLFHSSKGAQPGRSVVAHSGQDARLNEVYAILRRFSVRMADLEKTTGNLRRDFNRIDRALYREKEGMAPLPPQPLLPPNGKRPETDLWALIKE